MGVERMMIMSEQYYTIDEAAERIGVHPKTVRRYIFSGKIEGLKLGGQWRIYEEALDNFLNKGNACNHENGHSVSKDDFCVFMDSDYFESTDTLQVCTIVDHFVEKRSDVSPMTQALMEVMNDDEGGECSSRFNYVYDASEQKARFVFWGKPAAIARLMLALEPFEQTQE